MENNIPQKIKKIRITKGYTQKEFAELLQVKQNVIRDIELGKQNITITLLTKIIEKFEIDPRYFFDSNLKSFENKRDDCVNIPYVDITDITAYNKNEASQSSEQLTLSKKIANILNINDYPNLYAAICPTDAVAPEIKKNDIIIINNNCTKIIDGNFYIIKYFSEIIIRKIIITDKYILKALDSLHTDIVLDRKSLNANNKNDDNNTNANINILGEIKCVIKNL